MTIQPGNILSLFFMALLSTALLGCSHNKTLRLYSGPPLGSEFEATLMLPMEFELLSVDGQKVSANAQTFRNSDLSIQLPAGPHILVLQYSDIWQIDDENHDALTSGRLVFDIIMAKKEVFLVKAPPLKEHAQALNFIKNPQVHLQSSVQSVLASHIKKEDPLVFKTSSEPDQVEFPRLQQLKFWWAQASEFERQQFKKWQAAGANSP
ncbi:hypothetical protein A9Q73_02345 [Bermanella sp. 47_1433_sub80_T6]|nr:hypothetical protein A9Q73_02345 [Bermanella sp. 47_1433_sub80_T6]